MLYSVPNGSTYLKIIEVLEKNDKFMKCKVVWLSKVNKNVLATEDSLKIPLECFDIWERTDE